MRLPDFIAVGPQRTGTTWLYGVLRGRVRLNEGVKETMFFDRHYERGLSWYAAHFTNAAAGGPAGEIAPTYFHCELAPARIRRDIPGCRIICTLREPVARLQSLYALMLQYGTTRLPFVEAIERHPEMLETSRYATHLARWRDYFGSERVLVMVYDDLLKNPAAYLSRICKFIRIEPFEPDPSVGRPNEDARAARFYHLAGAGQRVANALRARRMYPIINLAKMIGLRELFVGNGAPVPRIPCDTAERIRALLMDEIERLEAMLGRDLTCWKQTAHSPGHGQPNGRALAKDQRP